MKKFLLILVTLTMMLSGIIIPTLVTASSVTDVQAGVQTASPGAGSPTIDSAIPAAINTISIIVGVVSIIMVIFGGFKYITSGGDANKMASAKNTIIYALIGIAITVLAQFMAKYVISKSTQATLPTCVSAPSLSPPACTP